jgi:hypothetical protein
MARAEGYPVTASIMAWKKTIGKVKLTKPFRVRLLEMEEQHAQASGSSS